MKDNVNDNKKGIKSPIAKNRTIKKNLAGLIAIGELDTANFDLNYAIGRNIKNLDTAVKAYDKSIYALNKELAKLNEDGAVMVTNGFLQFEKGNEEKYTTRKEELDEKDVEVKLFRLKLSELKPIKGVTGNMIADCLDLIEDDLGLDKD